MINKITLGTFQSGVQHGFVGFKIELNGNEPSDNIEIANAIVRLEGYDSKYRNVLLHGSYCSDLSMYTFVKALSDRQYNVSAIIDGSVAYSWLKFVKWLIVERDSTPWPGFFCNEFRFVVLETSDAEPIVPPTVAGVPGPFLYIDWQCKLPPDKLIKYLESLTNNWHVYSAGKKYEINVWER